MFNFYFCFTVVLGPTRDYFAHMKTPPLRVGAAKRRHLLDIIISLYPRRGTRFKNEGK